MIASQQSTIIATSLNLKNLKSHRKEKLIIVEDQVFYSQTSVFSIIIKSCFSEETA